MRLQPFLDGDGWTEVRDGNDTCRALFDSHYSRQRYQDGRRPKLFMGPGEKTVLLMADAGAVCAWRKFKDQCIDPRTGLPQAGINCAIFRREAGELASDQLRAAMAIAWTRWPGERLYTYIDPMGVTPTIRASRPTWGHCFYQAGWRFCGLTKARLHILECLPAWVN